MLLTTDGLVLRETNYKDSDKILTVLTSDLGKITVSARHGRANASRVRAGTQLFAYSDFTLFLSKGRYSLNEAEPKELFLGLRSDILKLSLASYVAEVLEASADEDAPTPGLLRTGLNTLFALANDVKPMEQVKAAFELRLAGLLGYAPDLSGCSRCGESGRAEYAFSSDGQLVCRACAPDTREAYPLSKRALDAMRFVQVADVAKFLSFSLPADALAQFSRACEGYFLAQMGTTFRALTFYRSLDP